MISEKEFNISKDGKTITDNGERVKLYRTYGKMYSTESWRPKTGHMTFGIEKEKLFNWVVAIPQGKVDLTYTQ